MFLELMGSISFKIRPGCRCSRSSKIWGSPPLRNFLPLPSLVTPDSSPTSPWPVVRIQQFNVLADGLAALREDLGKFSRIDKSVLDWEVRKVNLLKEITQYDADIITLQECDHYHDFFQPQLDALGYSGYFGPKPTSACLEVGNNSDGCALFVKRSKFRVTSCESKTLALSIAKLTEGGELEEDNDKRHIQAQNQLALIAILEFIIGTDTKEMDTAQTKFGGDDSDIDSRWHTSEVLPPNSRQHPAMFTASSPPPLLVSTVHLKSAKTAIGERYRQKGILQVLNDLARISSCLGKTGRPPAIILTGDFNAIPEKQVVNVGGALQFPNSQEYGYSPLTYRAAKIHSLGLRSVYNDDLPTSLVGSNAGELYTTWKARKLMRVRDGQEVQVRESVGKRCIDYIFYAPYRRGSYKSYEEPELSPIVVNSSTQLLLSLLMRAAVYLFGVVVPSTALLNTQLESQEKALVVMAAALGLIVFEIFSQGSIFRPEINEVELIEEIDSEAAVNSIPGQYLNNAGRAISTGTTRGKELVKSVKTLSKRLQDTSQYGNPGMQAIGVLDLLSDDQVGPALLPNADYPSDHVALVADLELMW